MSWQDQDTATSHFIESTDEPGLKLHLRAHRDDPKRAPVLFVHGATFASRLYDIPHPGASWLAATAMAGMAAYALDIRGYGKSRSDRIEATRVPYAAGQDAVRDIADAVVWVRRRHNGQRLALVGGSWGSITAAKYAAQGGQSDLAALALYAPIYAEKNVSWLADLADPDDLSRLNTAFGAAREITEAETRTRWDKEIPAGAGWREEPVFQALIQSSLSDDPGSLNRNPPSFRAPNGTFVDLWEAFNGRPTYDPRRIACPTLLIRGGADTTSTRSDALQLFDALGSLKKHYVEVANGAHFASAERSAPEIFSIVSGFLGQCIAGLGPG